MLFSHGFLISDQKMGFECSYGAADGFGLTLDVYMAGAVHIWDQNLI